MIMVKRLMWDFLGWNIAFSATEQQPHIDSQSIIVSPNSYDAQHSGSTGLTDEKQQASQGDQVAQVGQSVERYTSLHVSTRLGGIQQSPIQQADNIALQRAEHFDIHVNLSAATPVHPHQQPNNDHDALFKLQKSPYTTPAIVERFRTSWLCLAAFVRIALPIWFGFLIVALILIRYHYSADILVAIFVTILASTNTHMLQGMVRLMYRPYYHNYLYGDRAPHMPVYLRWPLNAEQVNYEERVRRVGIGGVL